MTPGVPLRAALYLRVSTARQAEHDVSIPDQKRQGEAYCLARGYQLVETFIEPGASATNDRRPEFQRMIEAGTTKPAPFPAQQRAARTAPTAATAHHHRGRLRPHLRIFYGRIRLSLHAEPPTVSRALWGARPTTCNGFTTAFSIRPPHGRKRAGLWQKLNGIPVNFTPVSALSSPISAGRPTASSSSITSAAPLSSGSKRARTRSKKFFAALFFKKAPSCFHELL